MPNLLYVVERMTLADIDQVIGIEEMIFTAPWSARAYRFELTSNAHSTMLVVRQRAETRRAWWSGQPRSPVLGYGGFWHLVDEAHIATIGVRPADQGKGLGELLLVSLLEEARALDAERATLEVRVSNLKAQALYEKYGFEKVSLRRRYYADNDEDAYIMATPPLFSPQFELNLVQRRAALHQRLSSTQQE